jgi:hypothetical protein
MAARIIATVGAADANSYGSRAEAVAYFERRANSALWTAVVDQDDPNICTIALLTAMLRLEQRRYHGTRATTDQALSFPRIGARDRDGNLIPATIIPPEMKRAQFELAYEVLGADPFADTGLEGLASLKVGPIELTPRQRAAGALPAHVRREIRHLLDEPSSANVFLERV